MSFGGGFSIPLDLPPGHHAVGVGSGVGGWGAMEQLSVPDLGVDHDFLGPQVM